MINMNWQRIIGGPFPSCSYEIKRKAQIIHNVSWHVKWGYFILRHTAGFGSKYDFIDRNDDLVTNLIKMVKIIWLLEYIMINMNWQRIKGGPFPSHSWEIKRKAQTIHNIGWHVKWRYFIPRHTARGTESQNVLGYVVGWYSGPIENITLRNPIN